MIKEIILDLKELSDEISQQLNTGDTSLEKCHDASKKALEIIERVQEIVPELTHKPDLEEIKDKFEKVLDFKFTPTENAISEELTYSRYCTFQIQLATRNLLMSIQE